jgi:hypothetical protein
VFLATLNAQKRYELVMHPDGGPRRGRRERFVAMLAPGETLYL